MASHNNWKLEDAKARFSELVRTASERGPQRVSVRGHDRAVVLSVEDYERLRNAPKQKPLVAFMEGLALAELDLTREDDRGRDIDF